jgi:hypothetical protein
MVEGLNLVRWFPGFAAFSFWYGLYETQVVAMEELVTFYRQRECYLLADNFQK